MTNTPSPDIASDILTLYELSLSVGNSLGVEESASKFIKTLLRRKNLDAVSLWLNKGQLGTDDQYVRSFSLPSSKPTVNELSVNHEVIKSLSEQKPIRLYIDKDSDLLIDSGLGEGYYAYFRLKEIGILELKSATDFTDRSINLLQTVVSQFGNHLKGCLAYESLETEVATRKSAEKLAQENEAKYRLLVEHANDIIYRTDVEGHILYVNPKGLEILGLEEEEIVGKHFLKFVEPSYRNELIEVYRDQVNLQTETTSSRFPIHNRKGESFWVEQRVQPIVEAGKVIGLTAIMRDVTESVQVIEVLQRSEEKYRSIIENMRLGLVEVDLHERIQFVNNSFCEMVGYDNDELIGQNAKELLAAKNSKKHEKLIQENGQLRTKGLHSVYEVQLQSKEKEFVWVMISGGPKYDPAGNVVGSMGIHLDITEQKEIEVNRQNYLKELTQSNHELYKKQQYLRAINEFSSEMSEVKTTTDLAWQMCDQVIDKFGFTDCVIYLHDEEKEMMHQVAAYGAKKDEGGRIKSPLAIKMGEGIVGSVGLSGVSELVADTTSDQRYIQDDKSRLSELAVPIIYNENVIGVIDSEHEEVNYFTKEHLETLTTIANLASTKLQNAITWENHLKIEEDLKESEERSRLILNSSLDAVITIDAGGMITEWNKRAQETFLFTAEEVTGGELSEFIIPENYRAAHKNGMKHFLNTGEGPVLNKRFEITAIRKGGEEFPIEISIAPLKVKGEHFFSAFIRDITTKKAAEEESEKALAKEKELNEMKSKFVAMTSHELRTPLTTIRTNAELLEFRLNSKKELNREGLMKNVKRIDEDVDRLNQLIANILVIGQLDSKKVPFVAEIFDLELFIRETIMPSFGGDTAEPKVHFTIKGKHEEVRMDKKLLRQILTNLVENAIKYTVNDKTPSLSVEFKKEEISIQVVDQGIGIPEGDLEKLFSPFFRSDNVGNIQGTGLGLAIVQEFVHLHGGEISVSSIEGMGTTFSLLFPK